MAADFTMSQPPFTMGAPIPALIWSSLEAVLETNMRYLAKDIAKTLGQPEAPLLQAIKGQVIRPYIFDEADTTKDIDMTCEYICQKPATPLFYQACGQPVLWSAAGTRRCVDHAYRAAAAPPSFLPVLTPLEDMPLFVSEDDTVYDTSYTAVGTYDRRTKHVCIFCESQ